MGVYAFFIEPNWFEVTHHKIFADINKPLRMAHLTDLHVNFFGGRQEKFLNLLEREKPDVIFITGDSVTEFGLTQGVRHFFEN